MPAMDLKTAPDRPQAVLSRVLATSNMARPARQDQPRYAEAATLAANSVLDAWEQAHGVTFAALDNATLERIREAEAIWSQGDLHAGEALLELGYAVRDLLGLGD